MAEPRVSKWPKIRLSKPQNTTTLPLRANGTKSPERDRKNERYKIMRRNRDREMHSIPHESRKACSKSQFSTIVSK